MWKPPLNFVFLHYCYIILTALLCFIIVYAYGNLSAIDAFFFGCSSTTESGLNTVDVKALKTYQQLAIYFFPIVTNLGFINIGVVVVRLYWFEKRLRKYATDNAIVNGDVEARGTTTTTGTRPCFESKTASVSAARECRQPFTNEGEQAAFDQSGTSAESKTEESGGTHDVPHGTQLQLSSNIQALGTPPPKAGENGPPFQQDHDNARQKESDNDKISIITNHEASHLRHRNTSHAPTAATSLDQMAASMFVLGKSNPRPRARRGTPSNHPHRSSQTTSVGEDSQLLKLTAEDRERLGGIEYRALKLLLKINVGYFVGLHFFGVICLLPWIHTAPAKYTEYLASQGQDKTWWAFYSSQTMINNLGFTLTPDSMITFADATWPMLIMTFLAFAGNTCYPILLRLTIWSLTKITPKTQTSLQDSLQYLLTHPRRCYTLLFPSKPTWILFLILFALNFIDVLLIIVLDLSNPAVTQGLPPGPRVLAALFQAASSRHTGTATFNLAEVNPAVQFSLLVMMYISIFPIAFSIRASNLTSSYEEQSLGKFSTHEVDDHQKGSAYLLNHLRNQLSFDLWYIFLGVFCICIAESSRIADDADPAFSVFAILFEVVSGYGNVGLSLGHPSVLTSLCGQFTVFGKVVVCAMMIRGRHRGLPVNLDRAIMLPGEVVVGRDGDEDVDGDESGRFEGVFSEEKGVKKLGRFHTS